MRLLQTILYYGFIFVVFLLGALLFLVQTEVLTGYELRIVQSGSMEPAISTGSLVLVSAQERYAVGDVITYRNPGNDGVPTTHRIIEEGLQGGELAYTTQGDANESIDPRAVVDEWIIGKVVLAVPYLGYLLDFARQPIGFIFLIVLPALLIVFEEVTNLWSAFRTRNESAEKSPESPT